MIRKSYAAAVATIAILAGVPALAATTTTTMTVGTSLVSGCSVSAAPLAFGSYTPGAGAVAGSTTITLRCSNGALYAIGLNVGNTSGASYGTRLLANGANTLQYNLYTSSARTSVWGDGSAGTQIVSGHSLGFTTPITVTVYGQVFDSAANQLTPPGNYSDTILVVLSY
jgi:spore coat protein U-like protein